MADQTILQETLDNNIVDGDWLIYWKTSTGVQRRVARSSLLGATLTGAGTIATGGFTLTVPATGTAALRAGTPVAGNVAQWDDANTVEDAGFAASNVALLGGRSGGQGLNGGTAANDDLTLQGTTNATRTTSYVNIQPNGGNVGIGTVAPAAKLHVNNSLRLGPDGSGSGSDTFLSAPNLYVGTTSGGGALQMNASNGLDFYVFGSGGWLKTLRLNTDYNITIPVLSGSGTVGLSVDNNGTLIHTASDARMKTDVQAIEATDALAMVDALRPVRYRWGVEYAPSRGEQVELGLIAQEVQAHVPEIISANRNGMLSVDYPKLTALLIGAVQALTARVEALEAAAAA